VHDALGNLRGVELPDGTTIEYLVDGEGRRVGKRVDGVLERGWLWSGKLRPVAELNGAGVVTRRFVYADGVNVPELMVTSSATYRLVKDHLGSVRRVVDVATGAVLQAIEYDAWGRVLSDTNPGAQPFGFAGGLYDADTGLVRFGAREYDAETGRWLSKDPILFDGGNPNLFAYAGSAPAYTSDPDGTREVPPDCRNPEGYHECNADCERTFRCPGPECKRPSAWLECYDWCDSAFCKGEGAGKKKPISRDCP